MILTNVRFSFVSVFEPKEDQSGRLKYSAQLLIPKDTPDGQALVKAINAEIDRAIAHGIEKGKFTAALSKSAKFKRPLRDGDEYYEEKPEGVREACRGHWFLNASNTQPVGVVGRDAKPLMSVEDFYSGCYGHADINFFAFNSNGNAGIGCSLNNVMKRADGERLDGRQSAEAAFAQYADTSSDVNGDCLE